MKKFFIDDDFLLTTKQARELYHGHAEKMPVIDYHCHLPPAEIAGDTRWDDIADVWLGGDHYKWRAMRSCGFAERFCSGRGADVIITRDKDGFANATIPVMTPTEFLDKIERE